MRTLRSEWRSYREEVVPKNAPHTQVTETEQAFYAGAASIFHLWKVMAAMPTKEAEKMLLSLQGELQEFVSNGLKSEGLEVDT